MQGRANTFLEKKYQNSPALPAPQEKNVRSITRNVSVYKLHWNMDNFKFNLLSRSQFDSVSISSSQLCSKYYHAMKFFWQRNFAIVARKFCGTQWNMAFVSSVSSHGITSGGLIHKSTDHSFFLDHLLITPTAKLITFPWPKWTIGMF